MLYKINSKGLYIKLPKTELTFIKKKSQWKHYSNQKDESALEKMLYKKQFNSKETNFTGC